MDDAKSITVDELIEMLEWVQALTNESQGVAGWHLNGNIAEWDEFEEVAHIDAILERHKSQQEGE